MINVVPGRHGENPKFETKLRIQIIDTSTSQVRIKLETDYRPLYNSSISHLRQVEKNEGLPQALHPFKSLK